MTEHEKRPCHLPESAPPCMGCGCGATERWVRRKVRLDHLLGVYAVGSGPWSWKEEYRKLIHRPVTQKLLADVIAHGIREPILLGNDGRVWDGHHRIAVAMHLGFDSVPVEFAKSPTQHPEPEWEYGVWNGLEHFRYFAPSLDSAYQSIADETAGMPTRPKRIIKRRRKAGPWAALTPDGQEGNR